MTYLELLRHSYDVSQSFPCPPSSRHEFLSGHVFNFTTYDSDLDELFARKAVEVCEAINNRTTYQYIENDDNRMWFTLMCNMPFFVDKITWGTSIRGAFWSGYPMEERPIVLDNHGLYMNGRPLETMEFSVAEWKEFIAAMIIFARESVSEWAETKICNHRKNMS